MKIKHLLIVLLLLGTSAVQTGCETAKELGNLSIVTGIFLEESYGEYTLIADCVDFSAQTEGNAVQSGAIRVKISSVEEAFPALCKHSETPLYFARTKVLLLGENVSDSTCIAMLKKFFDAKTIPSDIAILRTALNQEELLLTPYQSFGLSVDRQLKKEAGFSDGIKLYELIKHPENISGLPTVYRSENGFFLQPSQKTQKIQKEGSL